MPLWLLITFGITAYILFGLGVAASTLGLIEGSEPSRKRFRLEIIFLMLVWPLIIVFGMGGRLTKILYD